MKVGVIIITYNAMTWVEKCFLPLVNVPDNSSVYIIDNGSTDGTQDYIKENCKNFHFYQSDKNLGFGKANNWGFEIALKEGCSHFLLLNQDAQIDWKDIMHLTKLQQRFPEFGILSPLQLYNDHAVDFLHLKSLMRKNFSYFNDLMCGNPLKEIYEIGYTNAAIWLLSKQCLKEIGGFDPLFPHYGEDSEYAQRLNAMGLKTGLAAQTKAYHFRNQERQKNKTEKYYHNSFLLRLLNPLKSLFSVWISIFMELLRSSLSRLIGKRGLANKKSWTAFIKLTAEARNLKKHRNQAYKHNFSFINYQ